MIHKTLGVIQARMSSSRLPGKVLSEIAGKPLLQHMFDRVKKAKLLDRVVLASTIDPSDDVLEQFCQKQGISCFRGSLPDVLDRCYRAAAQFHAEVIVRLTADCPLIDPTLIDLTILAFLGMPHLQTPSDPSQLPGQLSPASYPFDYSTNRMPPPWKRTVPIGLDVEVCSFESLQRAWKESDQPYQREHVMPYLYEGVTFQNSSSLPDQAWYLESGTTPRGFRIALLNHSPDYGSLRWTVDTPADLEFVRQIFKHFEGQSDFSWQDILTLLNKEPELASINADVNHKSAFDVDQRNMVNGSR
jgi:spore coat polysaccharide biosynthesis protein SpsF